MSERPPAQRILRAHAGSRRLDSQPAQRTSQEWSRHLLDVLPAAAYICDADGLITYFNQQAVELWGREPKLNDPADRYCGSFRLFSIDGSPLDHEQCWMARALIENKVYDDREMVIERSDGTRRLILAHARPIHVESGALIGAVNWLVDITERKRVEESLRQGEVRNQKILESSIGGIYIYDVEQGRNSYINPQYTKLTGYTLEQLNAMSAAEFFNLFHPEDRPRIAAHIDLLSHALLDGHNSQIDYRFKTSSGEWAWYTSCDAVYQRDESGRAMQFIGTFIDITEQKSVEDQLRRINVELEDRVRSRTESLAANERRYRSLIENANDAIITVRRDETISYANPQSAILLGVPQSEIIGHHFTEFGHPEDNPEIVDRFRRRMRGEPVATGYPVRAIRRNGEIRWCEISIGTQWEDNQIVGTQVFLRDVTDRKIAEAERAEAWARFESIAQTVSECYWRVRLDEDGAATVEFVSAGWERIWGYSPQQIYEDSNLWLRVILPDDLPIAQQAFRESIVTGRAGTVTYRIRSRQGELRWVEHTITPIVSGDGDVRMLEGTARDITERKLADHALQDSEQRFKLIVQSIQEYAIIMLDTAGYITSWNEGAERINGYKSSEILGKHFSCFYTSRDIAEGTPSQILQTAIAVGQSEGEGWRTRKDGVQFWGNVVITRIQDHDGRLIGFAKVTRDLTARRRAEEALRRSEKRLVDAQRVGGIGCWEWNVTTETMWWSAELYRMFDVDPRKVIPSLEYLLDKIDPQNVKSIRERVQETLDGGKPFDIEYELRVRDVVKFHTCTGELICDDIDIGQSHRLLGTVHDVTDKHHAQAQLRRTERLAALGTLAAGIAHEINNPMSAAWTAAETAKAVKGKPEKDELLMESLDAIAIAVQRCQAIIDSMLRFARHESSNKQSCDLNELVCNAIRTTESFVKFRGATIALDLADGLPPVMACGSEIEQVLVNLIRNAAQSSTPTLISISTEFGGDRAICVRVGDNGRGISQQNLERIFDPFFTQRDTSEGMGLGLAIAERIIEDHEGRIEAESRVGQGTAFTVSLPLAASQNSNIKLHES